MILNMYIVCHITLVQELVSLTKHSQSSHQGQVSLPNQLLHCYAKYEENYVQGDELPHSKCNMSAETTMLDYILLCCIVRGHMHQDKDYSLIV